MCISELYSCANKRNAINRLIVFRNVFVSSVSLTDVTVRAVYRHAVKLRYIWCHVPSPETNENQGEIHPGKCRARGENHVDGERRVDGFVALRATEQERFLRHE